mgnify:FL=1
MDSRIKRRAILISAGMILLVVFVTVLGNSSGLRRYLSKQEKSEENAPSEIDSLTEDGTGEAEAEEIGSYAKEGFAGSDPSLQVGDDLRAFLQDSTFFDRELSSYEKKLLEENDKSLYFVTTSVERDLRIQILDAKGTVVTGVPFVVELKEQGTYKDQDRDGIIYISNLSAGDYEVALGEVPDYETPKPTVVSVRDKVAYTAIPDITLLMKTEADIIAEEEDTGQRDAEEDADETEIVDIRELGEEGQMGIDVSKWNGEIDWDRVRNAGITYAIIRCGYRGSSTGALVEDPYFRQNMQGALSAGLKVGIYFFTQATNEVEAVEEASMALALCRDYRVTYPIFIDTEGAGGNGRADGLDMETRTKVCQAFCRTVEDAGYSGGIYGSRNWFRTRLRMDELENYVIWLAEYREKPVYGGTYHLWQYTSSGNVDGIEGRVDLDISYLAY